MAANSPAGDDNFGSAVAIWHDPATGIGRAIVGIPGLDEATSSTVTRANLGAVQTFTTQGVVPTPSTYKLFAETLPFPTIGAKGVNSLYDEATKTLFVASPVMNSIFAFANEGLYWRPIDLDFDAGNGITPWSGSMITDQFGIDMDISGNNIVVGSPAENRAYIYRRTGSSWVGVAPVMLSGSGSFGSSVAISGQTVVVGAPNATVRYRSPGSPDLNRFVTISNSGAAYTYAFANNAWGTTPSRMLMPSDPNLPKSFTNLSGYGDWVTVSTDRGDIVGSFSFDYRYDITSYKVNVIGGRDLYVRVDPSIYPSHRIRGYRSGFLDVTANLEAQGRQWVTRIRFSRFKMHNGDPASTSLTESWSWVRREGVVWPRMI